MKMLRLLAVLVLASAPNAMAAPAPSAPPALAPMQVQTPGYHAAAVSAVSAVSAVAPVSLPAPVPNTAPFNLMALAMAVGATSVSGARSSKPTQDQIDSAKARGINVVSRTGSGEPDAEDYTTALATGSSTVNQFLSEKARAANAPQESVGKSLGELAMMSDSELQAEADKRGITVPSAGTVDNGSGEQVPAPVSRAALIKALSSGPASGKMDETVAGGRYVNTAGQFVNAHGQRINEDGTMLDPNERPRSGAEASY